MFLYTVQICSNKMKLMDRPDVQLNNIISRTCTTQKNSFIQISCMCGTYNAIADLENVSPHPLDPCMQ